MVDKVLPVKGVHYREGCINLPGDGRELKIGERVTINGTNLTGTITEICVGSYTLSYCVEIDPVIFSFKTDEISPLENP